MKNTRVYFILICLTAAAVLIVVFSLIKPGAWNSYSSYNPDPKGTKAAYLLMESFNKEIGRNEKNPADFFSKKDTDDDLTVSTDKKINKDNDITSDKETEQQSIDFTGSIVMIQPDYEPSTRELNKLRDWVKGGNMLMCFVKSSKVLPFDVFGFKREDFDLKTSLVSNNIETVDKNQIRFNKFKTGVSSLFLQKCELLRPIKSTTEFETILSVNNKPVIISEKLDKGTVILGTCPDIFTNSDIKKDDNSVFVFNILSSLPGKLYIDEFYNGFSSFEVSPLQELLMSTPVKIFLLQLILLIMLFLYYRGKRFGKPISKTDPLKRTSFEYVHSIANLYAMAKANQLTGQILAKMFKVQIYSAFRVKLGDEPSFKKIIAKKTLKKADRLLFFLDKGSFNNLSNIDLLRYAREMEAIKKEVGADD